MLKDHSTNHEVEADAVLDGDLDGFMKAFLLQSGNGERKKRAETSNRPQYPDKPSSGEWWKGVSSADLRQRIPPAFRAT